MQSLAKEACFATMLMAERNTEGAAKKDLDRMWENAEILSQISY